MARVAGTRGTAVTHLGVPLDVRLQRVGGGGLLLVGVCQHLPGGQRTSVMDPRVMETRGRTRARALTWWTPAWSSWLPASPPGAPACPAAPSSRLSTLQ